LDDSLPKIICVECNERVVGVIPKYKEGKPLCRNCAFKFDSDDKTPAPGKQEGREKRKRQPRGRNIANLIWGGVLLASLITFLALLPRLTSSFAGDRPARIGTAEIDSVGDQCINNLWKISKILQETGLIEGGITCPASGKTYNVQVLQSDTVVSCPSPELHKVTSISVSKNSPFPKTVQ